MKIGLIVDKKISQLKSCDLEIIKYLIENSDNDFSLIYLNNIPKLNNRHKTIISLAQKVLLKQFSIERKRLIKANFQLIRDELNKYFNSSSVLEVFPHILNANYQLNETDTKKIENSKFDILLNICEIKLRGEVINTSKYGVWFLNYFNNMRNFNLPAGFLEMILKKPVVKVCLIQHTINNDNGEILGEAFFNYHKWSAILTDDLIVKSSVSLFLKNFKNLNQKNSELEPAAENYDQIVDSWVLSHVISYIFTFYKFYLIGLIDNLLTRINYNQKFWTLFVGSGNFIEEDLAGLTPVLVPKGEFWADPFLLKFKDEYYGFFENYSFKEKRGKISCGRITGNTITDVIDVLDLDYHLSYPYVFREGGEIFMMPETSSNKRLEIYKCIEFPNKWELFSTAFEGAKIADAFFYDDSNNQKWLFLNKSSLPNSCNTSNLYIYKVDSLKLNTIEPHKQNPVLIDSRVARNGGAIFSYKNKIFRPSQRNTHGYYGGRLNINEIEKLSLDEYIEKPIQIIEPNFYPGMKSIHHLHQIEGSFIFDASYNKIY